MTLEERCDQLAEALIAYAGTHGGPNAATVHASALRRYYGGPPDLVTGRIGNRYIRSLNDALMKRGADFRVLGYAYGFVLGAPTE